MEVRMLSIWELEKTESRRREKVLLSRFRDSRVDGKARIDSFASNS